METRKSSDYAEENIIQVAVHFARFPIFIMTNVHCAAATENFVALEYHGVDFDGLDTTVTGNKPIIEKKFDWVPDRSGVDLNEDAVKKFFKKGTT